MSLIYHTLTLPETYNIYCLLVLPLKLTFLKKIVLPVLSFT